MFSFLFISELINIKMLSKKERDKKKIKAYMDEHKAAEDEAAPGEGQMPAMRNDGQRLTILDELLLAEVISAQEYEEISTAQKDNRNTDSQTPPAMPGNGQQSGQMPQMPGNQQGGNGPFGQFPGQR